MKPGSGIQKHLLAASLIASVLTLSAAAQDDTNLVSNGNFEADSKAQGWPDHWPKLKEGGSWETENGNHFLRMTSATPGSMLMLYREIAIPAGTLAIEMTWRQRVNNLKVGSQEWFDARIMMEFRNDAGAKLSPSPSAPFVRKDTGGWQEKSIRISVPAGSTVLKFMPALFQVESGTMDLDDVMLKPVAPQDPAAEKTPAP